MEYGCFQYCVSFRSTQRWIIYSHTHTHSFLDLIEVITESWVEFPVSYSPSWLIISFRYKVKSLSRIPLFSTPWTVAYQAPLSMGFPRQGYWSGLPFPSPGDLPNPGIESGSPELQADALPSEPPGKPIVCIAVCICLPLPSGNHTFAFLFCNSVSFVCLFLFLPILYLFIYFPFIFISWKLITTL